MPSLSATTLTVRRRLGPLARKRRPPLLFLSIFLLRRCTPHIARRKLHVASCTLRWAGRRKSTAAALSTRCSSTSPTRRIRATAGPAFNLPPSRNTGRMQTQMQKRAQPRRLDRVAPIAPVDPTQATHLAAVSARMRVPFLHARARCVFPLCVRARRHRSSGSSRSECCYEHYEDEDGVCANLEGISPARIGLAPPGRLQRRR
jgi:hypothetical protein